MDHERVAAPVRTRVRYDLRRMEALLHRLGDPHLGTPTVHIAGSKGKGSTAAMCASVLAQAGYRTGLFTSPHLHTFRERIGLDGAPVSEEVFAALVEEVWPDLEWVSRNGDLGEVTMFEALTAMAFLLFRREADFQVMEVGLGGRLDTTNLVSPEVCAITSLSLDHTSVLGETIDLIAAEKAGIVKAGVPVVTSPQPPEAMPVIEGACRERGAPLIKVGEDLTWHAGSKGADGQALWVTGRLGVYELWTPLLGRYQLENATAAVGVLEVLRERGVQVSDRAVQEGLRQVSWPCRMEVLRRVPLVVCDGAHNPYSVAALRETIPDYLDYGRVVLIVGVSRDKNVRGMIKEMAAFSNRERHASVPYQGPQGKRLAGHPEERPRIIVTRSRHPRAASTGELAEAFLAHGIEVSQAASVAGAVATALEGAREGDLILATGSLFVAAEAREALLGIEPELYPELDKDHRSVAR